MRKILSLLMMVAFSVAMFANSYWYRGVDNSWGATAMTESTDGLYEYIQSSNNANQFKIATSEDSWDYGWTYVQAGFNSTDVTNVGDYGQDNCYCWQSGDYYILVYYPNTAVNTTANPIICASTTLPEAAGNADQMYVWNGIGVTTAEAAIELGGTAEAVQADDKNNIIAGASQKGNWCLKANKGFTSGAYYLGIAMTNGVNAGDTIKIAYFRTTSKNTYVLGMDFSADKASVATTYQILSQGDPQTLESNGTPADSIFIVPEGVENAKYMRIYRNTGGTGLWVAKVEVVKKAGETPEQPEQPEEVVLPVVKLAGSLTSWEEPVLMANAEDSLSASVTLNLGIDHYQLKVVSDNNWLTRAGEGDLFTMHRDYPHVDHLNLVNTGDNIKLITDVAGEYTFTWTYADSSLVVTFPAAPAQPKFYITGNEDIVGEGNPTWGKNGALESFSDTLVMNLAAGQHKFKLITPAEQWLGMEALTDTAYGLFTDGDTNICFNLAEAGAVTVIYNATEFKLIGNFYVAPVAKYYLIGDSAFVVDAGATADKAWTPDAIPSFQDTTVLNLKAGQDYIMRLSLEGTWENHRDFRHLTDTAAGLIELPDEFGNHSIGFSLAEAGEVTIIYIPAANEQPEVFKLIGNFYVAPAPDPTVSVFGSMTDPAWEVEVPFTLSDDKIYASLTVNNIGAGEYAFKFFVNGEWRSNGYTYHRGFPGAANITENNDQNMIFQADVDGEYTFYWYFANDSAAIVYPEAPVVIPAKFYLTGDSALVVDAGLEADKAWAPAAIKVETDTMTLNLKAKQAYTLKITLDGEWATGRGYSSLSEKPEGITTDADDNIIFTLVENGAVNVIYVATEDTTIFKVEGNFYVAPAPDPTVSVFGTMTNPAWEVEVPFTLSDDKTYASLTVNNIGAGEYAFKFFVNGEWRSNGYTYHRGFPGAAGITENNEANMIFQADVDGEYTFYWYFANDSAAIVYPEAPVVIPAKFYLTGDSALVVDAGLEADKAWAPAAIKVETDTMTLTLLAKQEYKLKITLDGDWATGKGYSSLSEKPEGITTDADDNIIFTLVENGAVNVIYVATEDTTIFKVEGNFYVAPAPDPTVSVFGTMTNPAWEVEVPFTLSDDKTYASLTVNNIGAGEYAFKFFVNGEWRSNGYTYHRGFPGAANITENNDANMIFQADVEGQYTFYWYFANDSAAIVYPEIPFACDWDNIAWLGGSNDQIKVCKESEAVSVINVQKPGWAAEKGIYMTFPSAAWGAISLEEGSYVTEGAGLLVYLSALTQEYNEISIVCQDVEYIITIYNAANAPKPAFYLVGNFNEWTAAEAYKFALNPNNDAEYVLTATLAEKDSLKVIRVMEGEETVWYPADAENYVVDAAHAGEKDIYFRPDYQGGEDWYAQCIYVAENAPQGCDWDHIDFIGSAVPELADQFKLCKEGQYPSVINIQNSFGTEAGIYVTFPSAAFGEISMTEGTYVIQGAGMLLYCSAFTDVETEVSIVCDGNPIIFTVYNAEGSAPVVDPTVSVKGSMNDWAEEIPFVLSDDKTYASLTVESISAGNYEFKFIINGEWRSNGYRYHRGFPGAAGITENNEANMTFEADIDGEYTFYWYFANDSAAIVYPAKPEPVLTNGYYLVGSMNEWAPAAENLFALNPDNEFEYQLAINLDVNTEIKVVYVENDAIVTWYPAEGENYVIDDHHNGATTVYFRPDGQGGEDWFAGYFYIVPTSTVDITNIDANAPAVKILRDGQILIIKGEKMYNAQGQIVK